MQSAQSRGIASGPELASESQAAKRQWRGIGRNRATLIVGMANAWRSVPSMEPKCARPIETARAQLEQLRVPFGRSRPKFSRAPT